MSHWLVRLCRRGEEEVSLGRLYVMRAVALLAIWSLFGTIEALVEHAPTDRGFKRPCSVGFG